MRPEIASIENFLMCLSKPQPGNGDSQMEVIKVKPEPMSNALHETNVNSFEEVNVIEFGPIKVKPRKRPAPTLATGRRSKYEILTADEEQKRNVRRARNRAAAERVRLSRLAVEQQLLDQISQLETEEHQLTEQVENLENRRILLQTKLYTHQHMCAEPVILPNGPFDLGDPNPCDNSISTSLVSFEPLPLIDFNEKQNFGMFDSSCEENLSQIHLNPESFDDFNDLFMHY